MTDPRTRSLLERVVLGVVARKTRLDADEMYARGTPTGLDPDHVRDMSEGTHMTVWIALALHDPNWARETIRASGEEWPPTPVLEGAMADIQALLAHRRSLMERSIQKWL